MEKNKAPIKRFRAGPISASVWQNESMIDGTLVVFHTVSFGRSYKDKEGNWKTTNALRYNDLMKGEYVLRKAFDYLTEMKSLPKDASEKVSISEEQIEN